MSMPSRLMPSILYFFHLRRKLILLNIDQDRILRSDLVGKDQLCGQSLHMLL